MQIVSKCGGLPLAAKTLASLLYSRNDEEEWLSILNSAIWNLPTDENKIMSILKLSYDHLSPNVKRCFSYCSIFPKGHAFSKRELIRMWMAEGFLNSPWQACASPEFVGNEYFKILLLNSFFQDERKKKWLDVKSCRMHDIVHDLAILIAGSESRMVKLIGEIFTIDDNPEVINHSSEFRHLGLQVLDDDVSAIPSEIYQASKLHTFVSFSPRLYGYNGEGVWVNRIFSLSLLRVLNLSHTGIQEFPQSICKLKHLRYLDLSHTRIETFPRYFSQLYTLQTLRLRGCRLKEFPRDMRNMIGLEYLTFAGAYLTQMPREVSRLSKLKKFVGEGKGYGIEELRDLNLLGGKLIIENLGSGTNGKQANLMGKKNIAHLRLDWDFLTPDDSNRITKHTLVMNDLQPHPNLQKLGISSFGGSKFPTWMSTSIHLPNLVYITLFNCANCIHLPALGRLQSLRYLCMQGLKAIIQIGKEFYQGNEEASSNEEASFPSLVELHIISFLNLEEWLGDQRSTSTSSFSRLKRLEISECLKLSTRRLDFHLSKIYNFQLS
ncbi:putative disease resistance protein RGA3 [Papaver somniferum]|uniref:putative disease resistance protein RGA3 n=1 Tax=Papaver somniferum TaxID=3469 RepID=UPI000E6F7937|nr:putative disease resistance protein RGA3 [Papaver somniferum]